MNKKEFTDNDILNILKEFTLDEIHSGDFDQGQSKQETLKVTKTWWNKHKHKYFNKNEN